MFTPYNLRIVQSAREVLVECARVDREVEEGAEPGEALPPLEAAHTIWEVERGVVCVEGGRLVSWRPTTTTRQRLE